MTLKQWAENRWLRPHKTSRKEISDLLKMVDRDLKDPGGRCLFVMPKGIHDLESVGQKSVRSKTIV